MFPECRRLHEELNAFIRISLKETGLIIVTIVVWIGQPIVTHSGRFPQVDADRLGYFVQPFE